MEQFVFAPSRVGLLYQRSSHAIRRCGDGKRQRRSLFCRRLPLGVDRCVKLTWNLSRARCRLGFLFVVAVFLSAWTAVAGEPLATQPADLGFVQPHARTFPISETQARASVQWLSDLAIKHTPRTFAGDKGWGDTKKVWSGLKIRNKGLKLSTKRRFKEVRHGRWIKYDLTLPPPAPADSTTENQLVVNIDRVVRAGDLQTGSDPTNAHWRIDSSIETPMMFTARVERWNVGVQIYSLSVEGRMRVRMNSSATLTSYADYSEVPPALVIDPKIQQAELFLQQFEVDRVSKIGGDVAEEWGELMESVVRDVFLKKQNEKLVDKLNKAIDKRRGDLRLSLADWFTKW
jgi:hypothetical protein